MDDSSKEMLKREAREVRFGRKRGPLPAQYLPAAVN